jgi:hypothetical protein
MVALLRTTQIQEPSSATVNLALDTSGGVTVGQNLTVTGTTTLTGGLSGSFSGTAVLSAGTTSLAPLRFTSGTNLTSATAGALEYDGKVIYGTPIGSQRGVIPGAQFFRLNSDLAGANVTTAQSTFGVGVTLSASTVYAFEYYFIISKSAGTTSHQINLLFGGTATINNILYGGFLQAANAAFAAGNISTAATFYSNVATGAQLDSGITSAARTEYVQLKGTVSINAGGTFIPQYILNNAPGGAYSTLAGSYFYIYPISASGANTSVGTWA